MATRQIPLDIKLREDATFSNYIGRAADRLRAVSGVGYLAGDAGSGKSHLLQAACHNARGVGQVAVYLDELETHSPDLLQGLEGCDVVCLDDIESIAGVGDWEVALFHLINGVRDGGGLLLVSSVELPSTLKILLPDLRSRLLAADIVEADRLDDDGKRQLIKDKAARQGFELGDDVARYILSHVERSPRGLVDLLGAIEVETLRQQKKVTIPLVKAVLTR